VTKKERIEFDKAIAEFDVGLAVMDRSLDIVLGIAKNSEPSYEEFVEDECDFGLDDEENWDEEVVH